MILALLLACAGGDAHKDAVATDTAASAQSIDGHLVALDAPGLLRRMSIDLRGTLPAPTHLDVVASDPGLLETYLDIYLADERFEQRLVHLLAERWHTQLDEFEVGHFDYQLDDEREYEFERSVGQEPLRLMARVAATDRPWTDIVTTRDTMANELLAEIWPIDRPDGEGWQISEYNDGRPAAGVLGTNGMWWRYTTNPSNMNRGRAAAMTRLLLCHDILSRPVSFAGSAASTTGVEEAIATEPACRSCHATVDPLASSLFGFYWLTQYNPFEHERYHPERELLGEEALGAPAAYFGQEVLGLASLGEAVAADPRFYRCTAQTMAGLLWRREVGLGDFARVESLRRTFIEEGSTLKPLIRAIVQTPEYQVGALAPDAPSHLLDTVKTRRLLVADQLASILEASTGFRWEWQGHLQLDNDALGYRVLGGGVDGDMVSQPQREPGLTWALVVKRAAQAAAAQVVAQDLGETGGARVLLEHVDRSSLPEDPEFELELKQLHWRLLAKEADAAWLSAASDLWSEAYALSDVDSAWEVVASSLLRDPDFVTY